MLTQLVNICHNRYSKTKCWICSYRKNCPHDCGKCLHYIHTPSAAPAPRKYDCGHMMDYYVCKYAHKYTSELCYALQQLKDLREKSHIKVLSIGCGPCTDLLALDHLKNTGIYSCQSVDYRGIDIDTSIWKKVLGDINQIKPSPWSFCVTEADACSYIDTLYSDPWRPDVIILQYVFSDMQKHSQAEAIEHLLTVLGKYFDSCDVNTYIVCNDINLSTRYNGGREYFDVLLKKISCDTKHRQYHFNNSNKRSHFHYGNEYPNNDLVVLPPDYSSPYEPYTSCASAQAIIKKVKTDDHKRQ